jgi:DNA-binding transcriptional MerR regulator
MPVTVLDERLSFSTRDAAAAAGVSYRMVDYWTRCGAVWPSVPAAGQGSQRGWSTVDVERLCRIGGVVRRAHAAGLSISIETITAMWDALAAGKAWSVTLTA